VQALMGNSTATCGEAVCSKLATMGRATLAA
jgi:hypothetical protein